MKQSHRCLHMNYVSYRQVYLQTRASAGKSDDCSYYSWNLSSAPISHEIRWSVLPPKDWRNLYLLFFRWNFTGCQPSEQKQEVIFLERILFLVLYFVVIACAVSGPGKRKRKEQKTKNIVKDIYRARVKTQIKLVRSFNRWRELQHLTGSKILLNLPP